VAKSGASGKLFRPSLAQLCFSPLKTVKKATSAVVDWAVFGSFRPSSAAGQGKTVWFRALGLYPSSQMPEAARLPGVAQPPHQTQKEKT